MDLVFISFERFGYDFRSFSPWIKAGEERITAAYLDTFRGKTPITADFHEFEMHPVARGRLDGWGWGKLEIRSSHRS
jgi:hypothetical protein